MYAVLVERMEQDARADRQSWTVLHASGRFEMAEDRPPTVAGALTRLDELLEADDDEPDAPAMDPAQFSLRRALGVA